MIDLNYDTIKNLIASSESDQDYSAVYPKGSRPEDATALGRYQFTRNRINYLSNLYNLTNPTNTEFLNSAKLQDNFFYYHIKDILNYITSNGLEKYLNQSVTGKNNDITIPINIYGLIAGAHLGGSGGLRLFLTTNGSYDPEDSLGTSISDYVAKFSKISYTDQKKNNFLIFATIGIGIYFILKH